jgi:hypothetical protein
MYTGKNRPMRATESQNRNRDAAFKTIFRISKGFQKSKQKLYINFALELGRLKI